MLPSYGQDGHFTKVTDPFPLDTDILHINRASLEWPLAVATIENASHVARPGHLESGLQVSLILFYVKNRVSCAFTILRRSMFGEGNSTHDDCSWSMERHLSLAKPLMHTDSHLRKASPINYLQGNEISTVKAGANGDPEAGDWSPAFLALVWSSHVSPWHGFDPGLRSQSPPITSCGCVL